MGRVLTSNWSPKFGKYCMRFLPPPNEVWGKVIFLHLPVILFTEKGVCSGGVCSRGVCSRGVCFGGGVACSLGGCLMETPSTATAAGSTHPTGMHSCFKELSVQSTFKTFLMNNHYNDCSSYKGSVHLPKMLNNCKRYVYIQKGMKNTDKLK